MVRIFLMAMIVALAAPLQAQMVGTAQVDAVTLYPDAAQVTRQVVLDLPAGQTSVIVPDLPLQLRADHLRVAADGAVTIGAVNLAYDRLPVTPDITTPAVAAAQARIDALQDALRASDAGVAEIEAQAQAALDQIGFLTAAAQAGAAGASPADVLQMAQMLGDETRRLRAAALDAQQRAQAAIRAQTADRDALADAEAALAALVAPQAAGAVLAVDLTAPAAGQVTLVITTLEQGASWAPVYDLDLDRAQGALDIRRAARISQASGQDWRDVRVTLSTARPSGQIASGAVWPQLRQIFPQDQMHPLQARTMAAEGMIQADAETSGPVVSYTYPARVDIRDGVEDLRLSLGDLRFAAQVWAQAVPMADPIAYRMAGFTNDSAEILLPGLAAFYVDGALVGQGELPLLAAGADARLGFGPIDGLTLARVIPARSAGDAGVFTSDTALREQVQITLTNRTGQDWDLRLRDAVPYSEQSDLQIDITANPAPDRRDPDGQRGIWEWDLRLPAGAVQQVTLDVTLRWPAGFALH